jgi:hypothetical protein
VSLRACRSSRKVISSESAGLRNWFAVLKHTLNNQVNYVVDLLQRFGKLRVAGSSPAAAPDSVFLPILDLGWQANLT